MYGLVNKAIEDLVSREHGADAWARVVERAGVECAGFVSMESYPDELTYALVGSACEELEVAVDALLEAFGREWVLYTAKEGYGELLDLSGSTFDEFLGNLDALHARVGFTLPGMRPPSFTCVGVAPGRYRLHYRSERSGLAPMVRGLLFGLADRFGQDVVIEQVGTRDQLGEDVFEIELRSRDHGSAP